MLTDENPLEMSRVGSHGLRILTPTVLELTLINSKEATAATVTNWDFVTDSFQLRAPSPGEFVVSAGAKPVAVQTVGFKRRPLYAPLKPRDLRIASCLYLQLAGPIADGQVVEVSNPSGNVWPGTMQFKATAEPLRWSPAVHVNQVGYVPGFPKKAMAGYYLGNLGELQVPSAGGFQLVDNSGTVVFQGQLTRRLDKGFGYSPTPYQQVWEADFTTFTTPGEYRLLVPGLGTSYPFLIDEGVAAAFARTYAMGIFHQRCGGKNDLPFTRHVHDVCHAKPVQVPDLTFSAVNNELAQMTSDSTNYQSAAPLKNVNASLYPFMDRADRDVSGGHHDAGDYSKYTINSAGFVHFLVFAADAFPGVGQLDNLGLPESGDGKSDILQEAKWEADFLAKMQDADGGFYFLVYPRNRKYEDNVTPDKGDPQVVYPKTTAVTAAAVAALAETGSSPLFRQQFPAEAALYLERAQLGWNFLQRAIAQHGKRGAYQKVTHYGNEFTHDDELAWAAAAMFVATGDESYHQQLKAWYNPSDPNTRRWSWWRLYEGYGAAARTYAFAARSGRLNASALDPQYLAKCEAEIQAAADDHVRFARWSAYGTSFPEPNKTYRTAGWYFSSERAFDITVAYQLTPRPDYLEAVISNLNYEGGCNPVNMTYVTGLGSRRQREIVHQYAVNDRRVLPPSGIPLGNIQASFQYLHNYRGDLQKVVFPADGATSAPYPYYDRWSDTFNTTTEFVVTDQARSLASLAFWMAQTPLKDQAWQSATGHITGLPAQVPAEENVTIELVAPGIDLSNARIVWEARDQEPRFGNPVTFAAVSAGEQWVEAEAQLPDGRRIVATNQFLATTPLNAPPNTYESAALGITADMVALYHVDNDLADETGRCRDLTLAGNAKLDPSNLGWMALRQGTALRTDDLGDKATVLIPSRDLRPGNDTTAIMVEAMIYVDAFVAYNRGSAAIISLHDTWNAFLELGEDMYTGPYVRGGTRLEIKGTQLTSVLTPKRWHHVAMEINQGGYVVRINGNVIVSIPGNELANWGRGTTAKLEFGNFNGWIDEVVIRSIRSGLPPNDAPIVNVIEPLEGTIFSAPATISLSANAADPDGTIEKVEFYQGATRIGEVGNGAYPYTFVWNGVLPGSYSITAKAIDDRGASTVSRPVTITVTVPQQAAAAPALSPNGGSYSKSVNVNLSAATPGATIRFTLDGTVPTANSPIYTGALTLAGSAVVQAKAFKTGLAESPVARANFLVTALGSSGARVTLVRTDELAQGNWKGLYGLEGHMVAGSSAKTPGYAQMSALGKTDYSWSGSTSDVRGLQKPVGTGRVAGAWYSSTSFTINLNFTDGLTHRLAAYFVDWDRGNRAQTVEVLDGVDNAVLFTQTLSNFGEGKYLCWDLKGRVKIRLTRLSGANAVLSGLFFDPRFNPSDDPAVAPLLSCPPRQPNILLDGFRLRLSGEASQRYVLEGSADLIHWTPLSTNVLDGSELDLVDVQTSDQPRQFYRTRSLASVQPQYVVESSTDLIRWAPVALRSSPDLEEFTQGDLKSDSNRFYRSRLLAPSEPVQLFQ